MCDTGHFQLFRGILLLDVTISNLLFSVYHFWLVKEIFCCLSGQAGECVCVCVRERAAPPKFGSFATREGRGERRGYHNSFVVQLVSDILAHHSSMHIFKVQIDL